MLVQQILNSKPAGEVITVKPDATIREVVDLLKSYRIGGVIVSYEGKRADGILSERDIVRALVGGDTSLLDRAAETLMTKDPVCCTLDMSADDVLTKMTEGRFRHMPVVRNDELIGIVTIGDVVKARLTQLTAEKDALEGMIMGY